jgi:hypothetical protein
MWNDQRICRAFDSDDKIWWDAQLHEIQRRRVLIDEEFHVDDALINDQIDDVDDAIQSRSVDMNFHQWTQQWEIEWEFFIREMHAHSVESRNDVVSY